MTHRIQEKALQLGYEKCGIIKIEDLSAYADKLKERMFSIFLGPLQYAKFMGLAVPQKQFPWAKSIIVLSRSIMK